MFFFRKLHYLKLHYWGIAKMKNLQSAPLKKLSWRHKESNPVLKGWKKLQATTNFIQKSGNQSRFPHRKDFSHMWMSHRCHFETFSSLSPFVSFHLPNLKDNPCFNIYCASKTFSFLKWSNAIHIIITNIFQGYNCNYSNSIPQKTETTETTHLRNSKLYLLFYSIYEISERWNRIEIEHKRTYENIKTEQKISQSI